VTSKIDSRTILGEMGRRSKLLGHAVTCGILAGATKVGSLPGPFVQ